MEKWDRNRQAQRRQKMKFRVVSCPTCVGESLRIMLVGINITKLHPGNTEIFFFQKQKLKISLQKF